MFCINCGAKNEHEGKFCFKCGTALSTRAVADCARDHHDITPLGRQRSIRALRNLSLTSLNGPCPCPNRSMARVREERKPERCVWRRLPPQVRGARSQATGGPEFTDGCASVREPGCWSFG